MGLHFPACSLVASSWANSLAQKKKKPRAKPRLIHTERNPFARFVSQPLSALASAVKHGEVCLLGPAVGMQPTGWGPSPHVVFVPSWPASREITDEPADTTRMATCTGEPCPYMPRNGKRRFPNDRRFQSTLSPDSRSFLVDASAIVRPSSGIRISFAEISLKSCHTHRPEHPSSTCTW